jgi:signal transduction histidine kinase
VRSSSRTQVATTPSAEAWELHAALPSRTKLPPDPHAARAIALEIRHGLTGTLEELRHLIHGIYPSILTERGLAAALDELCHRAALPTELELSLEGSKPAHVETAAYFIACEALTNAARHAHASSGRVRVWNEGRHLWVEIVDDGIGGAAIEGGTGLRGLADRVHALGGRFVVRSPPGQGTQVRAEIPYAVVEAPALDIYKR